jgi:LysR substrate binding domain
MPGALANSPTFTSDSRSPPSQKRRMTCLILSRDRSEKTSNVNKVPTPIAGTRLVLTDDVADVVGEGINVAIRIGELADSSLITRRLVFDRRIIYAAPAYLDRDGTPATPDDLAAHNCLALNAYKTTLRDDSKVTR